MLEANKARPNEERRFEPQWTGGVRALFKRVPMQRTAFSPGKPWVPEGSPAQPPEDESIAAPVI
jgi:hypothetical protein